MEKLLNFDFQLLNQGFSKLDATWNFGPICSSFTRIYYVSEGEGWVTMEGRRHRLTPGHLYLIPAFASHYDHSSGPFAHYYIHCFDQTKQVINYYKQLKFPFEVAATDHDIHSIHRLSRLCPDIPLYDNNPNSYDNNPSLLKSIRRFQALPPGVRIEVNGILLQLISRFFNKAEQKYKVSDNRIIKSLYTIEQNLTSPVSLDRLAAEAALSKDAFIRLFRRQTGHTPIDYILRQRIQRAQILMVEGQRSVQKVARLMGYDNVSYFGRLFKKVTDMSPMEFIRQNR